MSVSEWVGRVVESVWLLLTDENIDEQQQVR